MGLIMMNTLKKAETSQELLPVVESLIHSVSAKAKEKQITPDTLLLEELALDSLDLVRVLMLIEDRYHVVIDLDEVPNMKRVHDLTSILNRELRSAA
jgi:acyl carrier protein